MRLTDIIEEEEVKHQERLRVKRLEAENERLKKLLMEHGILIPESKNGEVFRRPGTCA